MKKTICLNMIVKDESLAIERCLNSVKRLIDYWVIVDTGSTDGTQEKIRNCLKSIPGELHERPWVHFEHNRNEALSLAKDKGDYLLMIDADEMLCFSSDFSSFEPTHECYLITVREEIKKQKNVFPIDYTRICLIKSNVPWKWEGVVHETLTSDQKRNGSLLQGVVNISRTDDGGRFRDGNKYKKDALILEKALEKDPKNSRNVFYLAQSYRNSNEPNLSLKTFQKRAEMGGCQEEVFWSLFQVAILQEHLKMDPDLIIESYSKAYRYRPSRAEPLYGLACFHINQKDFLSGYLIAKYALSIPMPQDRLFVVLWIYEFGILSVFADCAHQIGETLEAETAWSKLLAQKNTPDELKNFVRGKKKQALSTYGGPLLTQFAPALKKRASC
jgi:glycosyltransferase involved in cell wall biosynthesis